LRRAGVCEEDGDQRDKAVPDDHGV